MGLLNIMLNQRIITQQGVLSRTKKITFFGYRQRDEPCGRQGHTLQQCGKVAPPLPTITSADTLLLPGEMGLLDHADLAQCDVITVGIFGHMVAVPGFSQCLHQCYVTTQVSATHTPGSITATLAIALQVDRLVSTMKSPQAQVDDGDLSLGFSTRYPGYVRHNFLPVPQGTVFQAVDR